MKNISRQFLAVCLGMFIAIAGCQTENGQVDSTAYEEPMGDTTMGDQEMMQYDKAIAVIHSNSTEVEGWATFTKVNDGVRVQAEISGLSEGNHGFHIHTYGDCRADDYSSAGGHYNPASEQHGAPTDSLRHMGDAGNITADAEGVATIDYVDSVMSLSKILGRGVIVHQGEDDLTSQPSGAAGARIGCGVIGIANTAMTDTANTGNM